MKEGGSEALCLGGKLLFKIAGGEYCPINSRMPLSLPLFKGVVALWKHNLKVNLAITILRSIVAYTGQRISIVMFVD